jgi:hypothetical protein
MAKLTISEAARVAGVARSTLHRAINQGRMSLGSDGKVDTSELLRLGYALHPVAQQDRDRSRQHATPATGVARQEESPRLSWLEQERDLLQRERDLLQRELDAAREREREAAERERSARDREARLLHLLDQAQQRFDRLLSAPEPTTAPVPSPALAPVRPRWPADTHQHIMDFMREHPGPHRPSDVQAALGLPQTPRHIMRHLEEKGRLTRPASGQYAYPDPDGEKTS